MNTGPSTNSEILFRRKMRDDTLPPDYYPNLANSILTDQGGEVKPEQTAMALYCLERACVNNPYKAQLVGALVKLMHFSGGRGDALHHLLQETAYLETRQASRTLREQGIGQLGRGEVDAGIDSLRQAIDTDPGDTESLGTLFDALTERGDIEAAGKSLASCEGAYREPNPYGYYYKWKLGQLAFLAGDTDRAASLLEQSAALRRSTPVLNLLAETYLKRGERDRAVETWTRSLGLDPLQTGLYLKMYDTVTGLSNITEEEPDKFKVNILFYTFNKLPLFKRTLDSLRETDIDGAGILILDNHCTDGTDKYLKTVKKMFPGNKVKVITLPTNIGAPGARNWLMAQPENEDADFVAYLDDDVILQKDWLRRLLASMSVYPRAAIAGGKIINKGTPKTMQYIYRFFDDLADDKINFSYHCPQALDLGQYDFMRKCISVMGCCHLLRMDALKDVGEFDIRFSPSQVDDIDHDLMTQLKGYDIIYNGHVEVIHDQSAGSGSFTERPKIGNVFGNHHKMIKKHPVEDLLRLRDTSEESDRQDLAVKINALRANALLSGVEEIPYGVI